LKIAGDLGKKPAEVLIAWSIQNDAITIPKSTNFSRLLENYQVLKNFSLFIKVNFLRISPILGSIFSHTRDGDEEA